MKRVVFCAILACLAFNLSAEVNYITTEEFKTKVMDYTKYTQEKGFHYVGKKPCIVDFYTTWCGPCKRLAPIMDELSNQYKGKVVFYKADTEKERALASFFQISSIPQVLYVPVKGEPMIVKGLYPKEEIVKIIDEFLLNKKKPTPKQEESKK